MILHFDINGTSATLIPFLHTPNPSPRTEVYQPGVIITTLCTTLALLAAIFIFVTLVWPKRATGSLKIQAGIFTFFSVWLFATQIPYTVFVAKHRAKITAFLNGLQLPAPVVQAALSEAGESDKYSKLHPGKPCSINCLRRYEN